MYTIRPRVLCMALIKSRFFHTLQHPQICNYVKYPIVSSHLEGSISVGYVKY